MASEGSEVDPQPEKAEPKFPAVASVGSNFGIIILHDVMMLDIYHSVL